MLGGGVENGRVTALDWTGLGLERGKVPVQLGQLGALEQLCLCTKEPLDVPDELYDLRDRLGSGWKVETAVHDGRWYQFQDWEGVVEGDVKEGTKKVKFLAFWRCKHIIKVSWREAHSEPAIQRDEANTGATSDPSRSYSATRWPRAHFQQQNTRRPPLVPHVHGPLFTHVYVHVPLFTLLSHSRRSRSSRPRVSPSASPRASLTPKPSTTAPSK